MHMHHHTMSMWLPLNYLCGLVMVGILTDPLLTDLDYYFFINNKKVYFFFIYWLQQAFLFPDVKESKQTNLTKRKTLIRYTLLFFKNKKCPLPYTLLFFKNAIFSYYYLWNCSNVLKFQSCLCALIASM
jgi:hypothetical protein